MSEVENSALEESDGNYTFVQQLPLLTSGYEANEDGSQNGMATTT